MATVSHQLEHLAARTGVRVAQLLSPRLADGLGAGLGSVAHAILTSRKRIAMENLRRAFGEKLTDAERREIVKRVFQNIGRTLIEFSRFGVIGREGVRRLIVADGEQHLKRVHDEGRGGIILTAHFGNWELMGAWVAAMGYPMEFLIGTQHNQKVDDLLVGFRQQMGVGIIRLSTSARQVFKALKGNHFAGLVSDQHAVSGVRLTFFDRPASTPKGPALFAIRGGCPILPFMLRRERFDRHVLMAAEPIYPPHSGDEEADIQAMTERYTHFFESCIRQYPDQWMWTHRRWKLPDEATKESRRV